MSRRRMLREAIANLASGNPQALPMQAQVGDLLGPLSNDAIAKTQDWQAASHAADLARRAACAWDASV